MSRRASVSEYGPALSGSSRGYINRQRSTRDAVKRQRPGAAFGNPNVACATGPRTKDPAKNGVLNPYVRRIPT